jgi:alanyl aminopeptidase
MIRTSTTSALTLLVLVACASPRPAPGTASTPPTTPPRPALTSPPGIRLPETFRPTAQRVDLEVVPSADHFTGRTEIDGTLKTATDVVWLNADALEVTSAQARISGAETPGEPLVRDDERVALRFPHPLPAGPVTLVLNFKGKIFTHEDSGIFRQQSDGQWYAFTQFEQTDARRAFPCVDEPSAKIPWTLTLHVPVDLMAVSNTQPLGQTPEPQGMKAVHFAQTRPLPSYLVAFGVGPFDVLEARPAGRKRVPVRIIAPRGHASDGVWAARVSPEILEALEDYFDIPYPYDKLDVLAIPVTVQFGAMENVGLVTFQQALVLARPEQDGVSRRRSYALVAAHEFAHQWFGDLVTTAWWNDIWLNEGFATWMQTKAIERWAPAWGMRAERVKERQGAAEADTLVNARVIRQPIQTYSDVKNAFDSITYEKGASVLRMFEAWVGEETFRRGVQNYLRAHADGTATSEDFLAAISAAAGRDIAPAFGSFLDRPGIPRIRASLSCARGGRAVLHLAQDRWLPQGSSGDRAGTWQVPVCATWATAGTRRSSCTLLDRPTADLMLESKACPRWVLPNPGYAGYYRLQLEGDLRERLLRARALDDAEVTGLLGDTEALVHGGAQPLEDGLKLAARFARAREHHVAAQTVSLARVREDFLPGRLRTAYAGWVRRVFGTRARALSLSEHPAEDDETKLLRPDLVEFVAQRGEDPVLMAQARQLAERWLSRPGSVDAQTLGAVMRTAGRFGSADFHMALVEKLGRTTDRRDREWLLDAISGTRDPALLDDNVALALSGKLDPREAQRLLAGARRGPPGGPLEVDSTRARILRGLDGHWGALVARLPRGAVSRLFRVAAQSCSAEERAAAEGVFRPRVQSVLGGPRALAQAMEKLDLCTAQKAHQEPELERFLISAPRAKASAPGSGG